MIAAVKCNLRLLGLLCLMTGVSTGPLRAADFGAVLAKNCLTCHNPSETKGGLDLSTEAGLRRGGKGGPVISAGQPEESVLLQRVVAGSMPPKKAGPRLSQEDVQTLRTWIAAGAKWSDQRVLSANDYTTDRRAGFDWWSLQPVRLGPIPQVKDAHWPRNPIDCFILKQLEEHGLQPAPETDRRAYIRRATFDLTGLPPTPTEIDAFLADDSPLAYERLVDRLLASPHYGERWGRHWLDVARFGESDGFENDRLREHSWPYRDYVIRSLNADKLYPLFLKEQLAGDVLSPKTKEAMLATGFLVAGPYDEIQFVGKSKTERLRSREEELEEIVGTVGQSFLGLTVNCARCHDHKFDPIPQTDYYRLKAVFEGVLHGDQKVWTAEEEKQYEEKANPLRRDVEALKAELAALASREWLVSAKPLSSDNLVAGRFGQALDPRHGPAGAISSPAFQEPPLSVECWARLDGKRGFNILVANGSKEAGNHWELYTYAGTGELSVYLPGCKPSEIRSGVTVTDGQWHHLAFSYDSQRVRLYVDGQVVKQETIARERRGGAVEWLYLGSYPPQGIGCDGLIDDVRITKGILKFDSIPDRELQRDPQTAALWNFENPGKEGIRLVPSGAKATAIPASPERTALQSRLTSAEAALAALAVPMARIGTRKQPEPTILFERGDVTKPGATIKPGAPRAVKRPEGEWGLSAEAPEQARRLRFAEWLANPEHPLTSRVIVNRIWQYHFGRGFLDTPSDFGFNGGQPSHPELLDWLASEFNASGGSWKQLHRLILLSATYRQSSRHDPKAATLDNDNRLLWRFTPRRLEAEIVRDAMLSVSGELNPQMHGPSFRPFTVTVFNTSFYHLFDKGTPEFNRRTVYRMCINTGKSPFLDALDCPAPSLAAPKRQTTITPLQALALMNDSFVLRQAQRMAERLGTASTGDESLRAAYRWTLGREPRPAEWKAARSLQAREGLASVCWALLNSTEFLYVD